MVAKLLGLLADRDRLVLVPDLLAAYPRSAARLSKHRPRRSHHDRAAAAGARRRPSKPASRRATGRTVALTTKVDPSIIGGVVTRIGSTVYDGSVARQLQKIRTRLRESA